MVGKTGRRFILTLVGLSFLFVLVGGLWPDGLVLTLTPVNRGRPMLVFPLEPGERFTLFYFHSVNHLPIWEEHSVDGEGRIYIEEERFLSFNAGMGHWQGHGRHVMRDGFQVIEGIHKPLGSFILRVGSPGVNHTILWRGTRTNLSNMVPGLAVEIRCEKWSFLEQLWHQLHGPRLTVRESREPSSGVEG
jgi:hypothetical protein